MAFNGLGYMPLLKLRKSKISRYLRLSWTLIN